MSKKPIKSSLFRFVTLRSPQALEDKEKALGLVIPEDYIKTNDRSAYYSAINGITDDTARETAIRDLDASTTFTLLDSKTAIKDATEKTKWMLSFSSWLMRNKNNLSYDLILSNLTASNLASDTSYTNMSLTEIEEGRIWDNLIYQTINKTSVSLRETFIQMLITNKFVQAFESYYAIKNQEELEEGEIALFTDKDEEEFRRRANASVVIEKEVLLSNAVQSVEAENTLSPLAARVLKNELFIDTAKASLSSLKNALTELDREEKIYEVENQQKHETDLAAHKASVKTLIDNTTPTMVSYTDPDTQVTTQIETYPDLEIPKFSFEPVTLDFQSAGDPFAKTTSTDNFLSTETQSLLQSTMFYGYNDFDSLRTVIKDAIKKEEQIILTSKKELEPKTVKVGGSKVTFSRDTTSFLPYSFYGTIKKEEIITPVSDELSQKTIILSIYTGRSGSSITNMSTKLVNSAGTEIAATHIEPDRNNLDSISLTFTLPDSFIYATTAGWNFVATYTFENSDVVDLIARVRVSSTGIPTKVLEFDGVGTLTSTNDETPIDPVIIPSSNGIASLGIADFLRVEQEVCCYTPGEVSHIENIMAREYKEKATRSLVSSEITTEQTRESEVENLTDTTSTERNELSSEVSSVIDQQNSTDFGASTSVSGGDAGGFQYTAGASFGGSSSNATSNSNSQAQTYAQEITERALERVVQKVSSKRSSRVLREFEENNTHGFDNRKGENHVTGVYRWVDKIYKNQLVNYGKRLMYEFSIPEPSRFLKVALFDGTEQETTDNGLIAPVEPKHPQKYTTNEEDSFTASYLDKSNYQMFAAKYNAEVSAYPEESIVVTKAFDSNYYKGGSNGDTGFGFFTSGSGEVEIPESYEAGSAKASVDFMFHPQKREWTGFSIQIAGKSYSEELNYTTFPYFNKEDILFDNLGGVRNSLAIAYESQDTGTLAISIAANCNLTEEGKAKWQNETYNAIMNAYYNRVEEYNNFITNQQIEASGDDNQQRPQFNPLQNRSMEKRELKRCAIELLTKSTNIQLAKSRYTESSDPNAVPQIIANESLQKDAAAIKFFEQAFDWEIMAYVLYPYYYSSKDNWKNLVTQEEGADPIFQAFLQSGMARVVVPVRPEFKDAVNWYMSTGEIWDGQGLVTDINDELYLSVAEEMLEPLGKPVGDPWETQVPTSLTIVQAESAELKESGLPCSTDCFDHKPIQGSSLVISGGSDSNASSGIGADTVGDDNTVV